jgi:hypothetical protein
MEFHHMTLIGSSCFAGASAAVAVSSLVTDPLEPQPEATNIMQDSNSIANDFFLNGFILFLLSLLN